MVYLQNGILSSREKEGTYTLFNGMGGTTNQREALQYAKNFQPFALNHQKGES